MTTTTDRANLQIAGGLTGRHVLIAVLAFFGVVFAVNGVFLYSALSTHTGVVAVEPYRKGLEYNRRIEAEDRQSSLGWHETVTLAGSGDPLRLELDNRYGEPVSGLAVSALVGRPSTSQHDRRLDLRETAPGRYVADIGRLDTGTWLVALEARQSSDEDIVYRMRRRLWVKQ